MDVPAINSINQNPRISLELVAGLDPTHPQIQIHHENMPQGWVTVVQMLHQALGAVLPHVFTQLSQQSRPQERRILVAQGMNDLRK